MSAEKGHVDLLLAWPISILDKITFFEDYLAEARAEAPQTYIVVLESLDDLLQELRDRLALATYHLARLNTAEAAEAELQSRFGLLQRVCEGFIRAHGGVRWTYTPWAEEETYSLLRSLFSTKEQQQLYQNLRPTILFTSQYNFLHTAFEQSSTSVLGTRKRGTLLILPKIAKHDCFAWPLLGHELAHAIYQASDSPKYAAPLVLKKVPVDRKDQVLSWTEELACDLIALQMFGPAYLFALAEHLLFFVTGSVRVFTKTHVAPLYRLEFLINVLESDYTGKEIRNRTVSPFLEIEYWRNLLHARAAFQRRIDDDLWGKIREDTDLFNDMAQQIADILSQSAPSLPRFSYEDSVQSIAMIDALRQGITVGSSRSATSRLKASEILASGTAADRFDELCAYVNESPNSPVAILNAGWMLKTREYAGPDLRDRLYTRNTTPERLAELANELRQRTWRIKKSIETSLIHSFYLQTVN